MKEVKDISVLIVEDELIVALNLSKELQGLGYRVLDLAASEEEAVNTAFTQKPDVILMDINLESGGSGLSAAKRIRESSNIPVIYVTAYSSDEIIELTGQTSPYGFILKPYNIREVKAVINTALVRHEFEARLERSEKRLKVALQVADMGVLEYDRSVHQFQLNEHTKDLRALGFRQNMDKAAFLALFAPSDAKDLNHLLLAGEPFSRRARLQNKLNSLNQYVDVYLSQVLFDGDKVQIGAVQDVTDVQKNLDELLVSDSVLHQMLESVLILNDKEEIIQVNPAFCHLVGLNEERILGQPIDKFLLHDRKDDLSFLDGLSKDALSQKRVKVKRHNDSSIDALLTASDLQLSGTDEHIILTLTDVSELVAAEKKLSHIAYSDSLTGFGNRAALNRTLENLSKTEDDSRPDAALFFIDLDSFKQINDTLGHELGDKVLAEFASRLRQIFRDQDTLIRIGGDEFVIVLTGNLNRDGLEQICHKIMQSLERDFQVGEHTLDVSCSVGVAVAEASVDINELLKRADVAMYQAKQSGKNTYRFFNASMGEETHYRIFIEQGLRQAIKNSEISIHLQPIVDRNGRVYSAEALCRWYSQASGFIPPDEFIPVAEESFLIQSLGIKVFHEAMLAKRQLNDAGFGDISININFSEKQLQNRETFAVVEDMLAQHELKASEFVIEITESTLHSAKSDKTIDKLRAKGFQIALDDFGTGYSSLSRLHDYNVNIIKIDKSFVQAVCHQAEQKIITRGIVSLGKELGYTIVAEGIEKQAELDALKLMGCDGMQGYYFAKPMPLHEFMRYLGNQDA
uniref:two-component system response regulator n=1 Tax=Ningiella ruwaisensis TaxID=2364274 RepID=UPI00144833AE|nr:EAL domain-containing protein [Ningiella ruwaisensis]